MSGVNGRNGTANGAAKAANGSNGAHGANGNGANGSGGAGPRHVGIIMDGNRRWAEARRLSRYDGYRAGTDAVRGAVECAADLGIRVLTLYAFSSDNWRRPSGEVQILLWLFQWYLQRETGSCQRRGVRISFIGRRDRFPQALQREIARSEAATRNCDRLLLRIAADYSARDAILAAAARLPAGGAPTRHDFARTLTGGSGDLADVDLIVRTGGEQRLSDFLLWEAAYAELVFTQTLWPDFTRADLDAAIVEFRRRERRFGGMVACGQRPASANGAGANGANGAVPAGRRDTAPDVRVTGDTASGDGLVIHARQPSPE